MSLADYQTGVATDPADLLAKLNTFAVANGWTSNNPTGGGKVLSKSGVVVGFNTDVNDFWMRGAISVDTGLAWNAQPNNAGVTFTVNVGVGPFTAYHFFAGAEDGQVYLHGVVEILSNIYRHFVFGELIKSGSYTGGTYVDGVYWSPSTTYMNSAHSSQHVTIADSMNGIAAMPQVWCDHDSKTNNWQLGFSADSHGTTLMTGNDRASGMNDTLISSIGYQRYNGRTPQWPAQYYVNRASNLRSLIGRIPDFRLLSMQQYVPGDIRTIGGVDWMIFPHCQRTDTQGANPSSTPASLYNAYAYRKN
jgi:hypothetical protein